MDVVYRQGHRELSEEFAGGALKSMECRNVQMRLSEGVQTARDEVLHAERALRKHGLNEPNIRSECIDGSRKTERRSKGLRRTEHELACKSLHVENTAQVLEVEEVQRGRGLRIAGETTD